MGRRILNDALRTIVNAERRGKATTQLQPISTVMASFLGIMKTRGYIKDFQVFDPHRVGRITVELLGRIKDCKALTYRHDIKAKEIEEYRVRTLPTGQTGSGHFSPIGGYHAGRDMALILDVARFKYPPHWVPLALLWQAMDTIDEATGQYRGFMLISKFQSAQSLLYTLSCRHESWFSSAKYLVEDLPILLKSESLHSVTDVLSLVFGSLPTNAENFIKWMAEVRRKEEDRDGSVLSEEEKARLAAKEGLLQQVQETKLFIIVRNWLSSCCSNAQSCCDNSSFSEIAASVCCQGAVLLSGGLKEDKGFCCRSTCVKCLHRSEQTPVTIVSGSVISGGTEQKVDMLVPVSPSASLATSNLRSCGSPASESYSGGHPGSNDILTVLLLALPSDTWMGVRDENLQAEISDLVSTEKLPDVLQKEVLHLRQQLSFLVRCKGCRK